MNSNSTSNSNSNGNSGSSNGNSGSSNSIVLVMVIVIVLVIGILPTGGIRLGGRRLLERCVCMLHAYTNGIPVCVYIYIYT